MLREKINEFFERASLAKILRSRALQEEFVDLYAEVTGKFLNCTTCGEKFQIAMNDLQVFAQRDSVKPFKDQYHNKMYKLKKSAVVFCKETRRHYTWESITDEIAEKILNENPGYRPLFESLPERKGESVTVNPVTASTANEPAKREKKKRK